MLNHFDELTLGIDDHDRRHANIALALALGFLLPNIRNQRLATLDFPSGPILSRVRCIAWFHARHFIGP